MYTCLNFHLRGLINLRSVYTDIIALLILGVLLLILFVLWQQYLEKVQNDPNAVHSVLTPPPLIQPSLWKRGEGKLAAMMIIGFVNWASFLAWIVWVQVFTPC
jgi:hypothetical protein